MLKVEIKYNNTIKYTIFQIFQYIPILINIMNYPLNQSMLKTNIKYLFIKYNNLLQKIKIS